MIDDAKLATILSRESAKALDHWENGLRKEQEKALRYYVGHQYDGDDDAEMDTWSKVVSRDVAEVVDWSLPEIVKLFLEQDVIGQFEAKDPEDEQAAEQASEYIQHVFFSDNDGFEIIHDHIKDGLLQKVGIVRAYWDEGGESTVQVFRGLAPEAVEVLASEDDVEIQSVDERDDGLLDVRIETSDGGRVVIEAIPPENFLVSEAGDDPDTVPYIAARFRKTYSELLEDGYDKKVIDGLSDTNDDDDNQSRDNNSIREGNEDKSQREYWVYDEYARVDIDGDGTAELINAVRVGQTVLKYDEVPEQMFAVFTPNRMPHRIIGRSVADDVMDIQDIKSQLWREGLDNLALANRPQRELPEAAILDSGDTIDDLINPRIGGVIRTKGQGGMMNDLVAPNTAQHSLGMIEYVDQVREQRTGISRHQQGLESDTIHSTMGGANRIMDAGQARRDLIARLYGNTLKTLLMKCYRLVCRHQDYARKIKLRGDYVEMDPRYWDAGMKMAVTVGIGTASTQQKRENSMALLQVQAEAMQMGLVQPDNAYEGLSRFVETLGLGPAEKFFSEAQVAKQEGPTPEEAAAQAEIKLQEAKLQADVQLQQAKAQADMQMAQFKVQVEAEKAQVQLQIAREKAQHEAALKAQEMQLNAQLKREEMEAQIQLKREEIAAQGQTNENIPSPVDQG